MTDKAISPLRRLLIEDMAIRQLAPRLSTTISATSKGLPLRRPVCRQGRHGGCPSVSAVVGVDRNDGTDRQRQCHCAPVLLQGHAKAPRSCRRRRVGPGAAPPPRCSPPGRVLTYLTQ
jgi:hypothetical protein